MKEELSFEDGVLLCKYIYQSAIEKTLQGVPEQEIIFYRSHDMLKKIIKEIDNERLDELLNLLRIKNIYETI